MTAYTYDDDVGRDFVIVTDEEDAHDGHGLDIGVTVKLVGLPRRVPFAPPPEPQWRCFEVLDGPEMGEWRNLDARHIAEKTP